MRPPETALHNLMLDWKPDAVVSTYPLYPYFVERSFNKGVRRVPMHTIITDSININASWTKAPTDYWHVTDPATKAGLLNIGLDEEKVIVTGFSVAPRFTKLSQTETWKDDDPFNILYFPTPKKPHVRRILRALLDDSLPNTKVTIVLGKNVRKLYSRAKEIKDAFPDRVRIVGWTKKVPQLLTSSHLVVGKAGGATVHEAIAACTPMFIHHLVPGQEEGNLELLKAIGGGALAETPKLLVEQISQMTANNGEKWLQMKQALKGASRPDGALASADFIMKSIKKR